MPKSSSVPKTTTKMPVTKKTVVKKAPAKKVAVKKTVSKTTGVHTKATGKSLVYADNQQSFWVTNGEILNSLIALRDALAAMDEAVYLHHARPEQNDFAIWVNDVLCDNACAQALTKAKTSKSAHTVVVKHLKLYTI
jgi:hydroxyethylthiazole kinase-like sugar kinase family protein